MHELKQLVDHCLEELPVVAQEAGVLTHHIPAQDGEREGRGVSSCVGATGRAGNGQALNAAQLQQQPAELKNECKL